MQQDFRTAAINPLTDLKDGYNRIFGKKIKKNEEVIGYYFDGYEDKGIEVLTRKKR